MAQLDTLETNLDNLLHKKAPVQLPENGRKWLAENVWWLALLGGLGSLWSALMLWQAGHAIDRYTRMYENFTGSMHTHYLGMGYYLSLLAVAATGVLMLVATTNLKDMRRSGWRHLFYAMLLQLAAGVLLLFNAYGGFDHFLGSLISATVGGYFLFQIRSYFTAKDSEQLAVHHEAQRKHHDEHDEHSAGQSKHQAKDHDDHGKEKE